jgi:hypothetical protein
MSTDKLEKYTVFVKLTVLGESPEDALDYANSAIDHSDLLDQDGVVGIALDEDTIEQDDEELGYGEDDDFE